MKSYQLFFERSIKLGIVLFLFFQLGYSQNTVKQNRILTDRFLINGGIFLPSKKVNISANGSLTPEQFDDIDFDEAFGVKDYQTTVSLNFMWRFSKSKNWSLRVEFFNINNSKEAILEENLEWNDLVFKKGSSVEGGFGMGLYKVFFGRVISKGDKHELGGGLGAHVLSVSAFLEGDAGINDEELVFERSNVSVTAPLPNIGFWYYYAPFEKWMFGARVDWLGIKIGDYGGSLWNVSPSVNYQLFRNVGLGLSYKYFRVDADVDKDQWNGNFNMSFSGPAFMITANF